jgi:hypothetical protein
MAKQKQETAVEESLIAPEEDVTGAAAAVVTQPAVEEAALVATELAPAVSSDNEIEALLLKANPLLPLEFAAELAGYLAQRGFTSLSQRKQFADAGVSVEYLFSSTIRNALNDKALNLYAAASQIENLDTTNEGSIHGVAFDKIFPGGSAAFASRIRSELGKQEIRNARDLSHRSAPPRIHQALLDALRVGDFGFDGQYILSQVEA